MISKSLLYIAPLLLFNFLSCESSVLFLHHIPHLLVSGELFKSLALDHLPQHLHEFSASSSLQLADIIADQPGDQYPLLPYLIKLGEIQKSTIKFFNDSPEVGQALTARSNEFWGPIPGNIRDFSENVLNENPDLKLSTSEVASAFFQRKADKLAQITAVIAESPLAKNLDSFSVSEATSNLIGSITKPLEGLLEPFSRPLLRDANDFTAGIDSIKITDSLDNIFNAPPDKYQQEFTEGATAAVDQSISAVAELAGSVSDVLSSKATETIDSTTSFGQSVLAESGSALARASAVFGEALSEKADVLTENVLEGLSVTSDAIGKISSGFIETVPSKLATVTDSTSNIASNLNEYFSGYSKLADELSVTAPPRINAFIDGIPGYFARQADNLAAVSANTSSFLQTAGSRIAQGTSNLGTALGSIRLNDGDDTSSLSIEFGKLEIDALKGVEGWLDNNPRLGLSTSQYVSELFAEKSAKLQSIFSTINSSPLAEGIKANIVE